MQAAAPTLSESIDRIETDRKAIRVCNVADDADLARLESFFEPHDVDFRVVDRPNRPAGVVDLLADGQRITSSPLEAVRRYVRVWDESMAAGLRAERPTVFTRLRDNYFDSYDKRRMIMASRIVEFRAWNVGSGTLHAGFQRLSKLESQSGVYRNLASSNVDVHVYGQPDREPLGDLDLTVHRSRDEEVTRHWWVAYDGAGDDDEKIVLLAQEREPNQFYGFWSERPHVVDDVLERMDHLG